MKINNFNSINIHRLKTQNRHQKPTFGLDLGPGFIPGQIYEIHPPYNTGRSQTLTDNYRSAAIKSKIQEIKTNNQDSLPLIPNETSLPGGDNYVLTPYISNIAGNVFTG